MGEFLSGRCVYLTPRDHRDQVAEILSIINDYVIESNDTGGLDCNNLVNRLEQAGYTLPDMEEGTE